MQACNLSSGLVGNDSALSGALKVCLNLQGCKLASDVIECAIFLTFHMNVSEMNIKVSTEM